MIILQNFCGQLCYYCEEEIIGEGCLAEDTSWHLSCYAESLKEERRIKKIEEYLTTLDEETQMQYSYGPAHVVIDDYNVDDYFIKSSQAHILNYLTGDPSLIPLEMTAFKLLSTEVCIRRLVEMYAFLEVLLNV